MQEITENSVPEGVTLSGVANAMKLHADSSPEKSDFGCRRCKAIMPISQAKGRSNTDNARYFRVFLALDSELNGFRLALFCLFKKIFGGDAYVEFHYRHYYKGQRFY